MVSQKSPLSGFLNLTGSVRFGLVLFACVSSLSISIYVFLSIYPGIIRLEATFVFWIYTGNQPNL